MSAKWNMEGLKTNLNKRNADNVVRAIVSNPDLLKELDEDSLDSISSIIAGYNPSHKAKIQEKKAAREYVDDMLETLDGDDAGKLNIVEVKETVTVKPEDVGSVEEVLGAETFEQ